MPFEKYEPYSEEKLKKLRPCTSSEHNPPSHIVLRPGSYTWKCPMCGKTTSFNIPEVLMSCIK